MRNFGSKEVLLGAFLASAGCVGEKSHDRPANLSSNSADVDVEGVAQKDGLDMETEDEISPDSFEEIENNIPNFSSSDIMENKDIEAGLSLEKKSESPIKIFEDYLLTEAMFQEGNKLPGFDNLAEAQRIITEIKNKSLKKKFGEHFEVQSRKYFKELIKNKEYRERVNESVVENCEKFGVPVLVALGVIGVESGGDNKKISNRDAKGIFQVKQVAVDQLKKMNYMDEDWGRINLSNLEDNIKVGIAYLRYVHDKYGQWGLALMAYNTGPRNFREAIVSRLYKYQVQAYKKGEIENKPKKWRLEYETDKKGKKKFFDEVNSEYHGGWPAFLRDNGINLVSACSAQGLGMCDRGYGQYPFQAMVLGEMVGYILDKDKNNLN